MASEEPLGSVYSLYFKQSPGFYLKWLRKSTNVWPVFSNTALTNDVKNSQFCKHFLETYPGSKYKSSSFSVENTLLLKYKSNLLMLLGKHAAYWEDLTKHSNTRCGQKYGLLNAEAVKADGT